jgi:hypothetical protein
MEQVIEVSDRQEVKGSQGMRIEGEGIQDLIFPYGVRVCV